MKTTLGIILFLSAPAWALGTKDGGGGKGVVCRDLQGQVQSVELLDLWEARVIYGRTPIETSDTRDQQVERMVQALKTSYYSGTHVYNGSDPKVPKNGAEFVLQGLRIVAAMFSQANSRVHWVKGAKLALSQDSFEMVTPAACGIEQIVIYTDSNSGGSVVVNQDLFDRMDVTNQAALFVHEAYYVGLRALGERSSIRARRAVGLAASGYSFQDPAQLVPNEEHYICRDHNLNSVHIFSAKDPSGETQWGYFVEKLAGRQNIDDKIRSYWGPFTGFDDLWASLDGVEIYSTLGESVGFDESYTLHFLSEGNTHYVSVDLTSAPDEAQPIKGERLLCSLGVD